jgi:hypothetical protein
MWTVMLGLLLATALACGHIFKCNGQTPASSGGGNGQNNPTTATLVADNSRCFVCHANFQEEKMVVKHAVKNVGCELCHGSSDAHCSDENNLTAPDKFYARDEANAMCYDCHAAKKLRRGTHKSIVAGTFDRKYCTECHGDHRMARRTRHWNKKTRAVIKSATVESETMVTIPTP